jgi:ABC-2 type transport system permease protein
MSGGMGGGGVLRRDPLRLARVLLGSQYAVMLEYRAEIALWALSGVLPFVMLGLWSELAASDPGAAAGLDPAQLGRYFLAAFVVRQFTVVWVVYSFEEDALAGRLAPQLLQPLPPLWRHVAAHLAEQVTRLPFVLVIVALFFALQPGSFWLPSPGRAAAGVLAIGLAFAINFLLQSCIACLCFWSERATALERLLFIPYVFLSGLVAPLQSFPPEVRRLAEWTPFPWILRFPAALLAGEPLAVGTGLLTMLAWIGLLTPVLLLLWRSGVRRYSAMGA